MSNFVQNPRLESGLDSNPDFLNYPWRQYLPKFRIIFLGLESGQTQNSLKDSVRLSSGKFRKCLKTAKKNSGLEPP
jgi:hypothetical protein